MTMASNLPSTSVTPTQQIVSSCSGALITSLLVTPLDVVKVRLQRQTSHGTRASPVKFRSSVDHHIHMLRTGSASTTHWLSSIAKRRLSDRKYQFHHHYSDVTPLDVAKIRLQSQRQALRQGSCFIYSNGLMDHLCRCVDVPVQTMAGRHGLGHHQSCPWYARPGHFSGTIDAFIKIARNEGVTSLWSGLSPTLVMAVPATVCYFTLYDNMHLRLRGHLGDQQILAPLLAGTTARFVTATIVSPLEMIRTKLQSERLSYTQITKVVHTSIEKNGLRALWQGLMPTIFRDVPFSAVYWVGYEKLKRSGTAQMGVKETNFYISFTSGALSGMLAAVLTQPFDVVKTHRQIAIGELESHPSSNPQSTATREIIRQLYRSHGVSSLYAGIIPRVVKIAPACAIMIGTYEYCKLYFKEKNGESNKALKTILE